MGTNPLIEVLQEVHKFPKKLQSNFVRSHPYEFARLASLGLITTRLSENYGYSWRCTFKGLRVLEIGSDE